LIEGLRAAGDDVDVFAGEVRHEGAARALDAWDPFARRALARRVADHQPDVIHFHHVIRELSASVFGVAPDVPKVLTVHDFRLLGQSDHTGRPVLDRLQREKSRLDRAVARRRVDRFIAVSVPLADALRSAGFDGVVHLPNFAPTPTTADPEATPPSAQHDVVFAGRLTPDKGVHELVEAFVSDLAVRHPDSNLVFAGTGPELEALERTAARVEGGRVRVLGPLPPDAVASLFRRARVVAIPSIPSLRPEGFPMVAAEAALAGRPVVVGDDPGLRAFVEHTGNGVAVHCEDPSALAAALDRYLADGDLADRDGAAGHAVAMSEYTVEAVVARVRSLYEELVAR
jgi:glycosyltransferase involved in cell wall biosynthesis